MADEVNATTIGVHTTWQGHQTEIKQTKKKQKNYHNVVHI